MEHFLLLFIPGVIGGMINAIAGGGGIIMYPALLASGLNPITASATAWFVVWPGSLASLYGFRKSFSKVPRLYLWLVLPCVAGAGLGAVIMSHTQPETFGKIAPLLVLSAVLLMAVQSRVHRWLTTEKKKFKIHWHTMPLVYICMFPLAIYGGFFGAGFGLMVLAVLGFTNLKGIHQMNAVKHFCGLGMAIIVNIYFARKGLVDYSSGVIMAAGTFTGGYAGARLTQRVSTHLVHDLTVIVGVIISVVLLIKS